MEISANNGSLSVQLEWAHVTALGDWAERRLAKTRLRHWPWSAFLCTEYRKSHSRLTASFTAAEFRELVGAVGIYQNDHGILAVTGSFPEFPNLQPLFRDLSKVLAPEPVWGIPLIEKVDYLLNTQLIVTNETAWAPREFGGFVSEVGVDQHGGKLIRLKNSDGKQLWVKPQNTTDAHPLEALGHQA